MILDLVVMQALIPFLIFIGIALVLSVSGSLTWRVIRTAPTDTDRTHTPG